jgi:hypothetical protein
MTTQREKEAELQELAPMNRIDFKTGEVSPSADGPTVTEAIRVRGIESVARTILEKGGSRERS